MSEVEIAVAQAYLTAAGQDPVAALIRSVKDLVQSRGDVGPPSPGDEESADARSPASTPA